MMCKIRILHWCTGHYSNNPRLILTKSFPLTPALKPSSTETTIYGIYSRRGCVKHPLKATRVHYSIFFSIKMSLFSFDPTIVKVLLRIHPEGDSNLKFILVCRFCIHAWLFRKTLYLYLITCCNLSPKWTSWSCSKSRFSLRLFWLIEPYDSWLIWYFVCVALIYIQ